MSYFVALDAGGTKTQCWIGDKERVLGRASTGTVKLMNVSEETATQRLHNLIRAAAANAGITLEGVQRTCLGTAGVAIEAVQRWAETSLHNLLPGEVILVGDEIIALDAAFRGGPGVLAIAGTGSNIVGRCSDGTTVTAGGWGPVIGDEGASSWVGVNAVRAAFKAYDRGIKTDLLPRLRAAWSLQSNGELIAKCNASTRPDFAELAPTVSAYADEGDETCRKVLQRAGEDLGEQIELVLHKMAAHGETSLLSRRVVFTGSLVANVAIYRDAMKQYLLSRHPDLEIADEAVVSLEGAMWLARGGATA